MISATIRFGIGVFAALWMLFFILQDHTMTEECMGAALGTIAGVFAVKALADLFGAAQSDATR